MVAEAAIFAVAIAVTAWSAMIVKSSAVPPLAALREAQPGAPDRGLAPTHREPRGPVTAGSLPRSRADGSASEAVRWFNGRPVRPARTVMMTVTGYSPDERSCGAFADGKTATLHSVWTNGMRLVAADTSILPFGSMLTVPGYAEGQVVPVLDRGGAIKGHRLDLLFPTHERARQWGVREIPVVIWEYADGAPAPNPRALRD